MTIQLWLENCFHDIIQFLIFYVTSNLNLGISFVKYEYIILYKLEVGLVRYSEFNVSKSFRLTAIQ